MTPQVAHSLRQYAIMLALTVLGFVVENQTGIMNTVGIPEIYQPIIIAALGQSVRWVEGIRDASRASQGKIIPSDVAYTVLHELAENPSIPQVESVGEDIYVDEPDAQVVQLP